MKKMILGLGSLAAIAAPVATVVACGDTKSGTPGTPPATPPVTPPVTPPTITPITQADLDALVFPTITGMTSSIGNDQLKADFGTDTTGVTRRQLGIQQGKLDIYLRTGTATWRFDESTMDMTFNVKAFSGTGDLTLTPVLTSKADSTITRVLPETHIKTAKDLNSITYPLDGGRIQSTFLHSSQAIAATDTTPHGVNHYMIYALSVTIDVDTEPTMTIDDVESGLGIDLGLDAATKSKYKVKVSSTLQVSGRLRLDGTLDSFPLKLEFIANDGTALMNNVATITILKKD